MKRLILVRHAKSDWTYDVPDFDRPLNERGHKDAPRMAKYLKEQNIKIEQFVTSSAKRALTTCRYFAEVYESKNIVKTEELYHASHREFVDTIANLSNEYKDVALFSHNMGISEYASLLAKEFISFPTCGVAVFNVDTEDWSLFEASGKKLYRFFAPKEI